MPIETQMRVSFGEGTAVIVSVLPVAMFGLAIHILTMLTHGTCTAQVRRVVFGEGTDGAAPSGGIYAAN